MKYYTKNQLKKDSIILMILGLIFLILFFKLGVMVINILRRIQ